MGRWSRAEIEAAFRDYSQAVVEIGDSGDWARYADLFTEDAVYLEHASPKYMAENRSAAGSRRR